MLTDIKPVNQILVARPVYIANSSHCSHLTVMQTLTHVLYIIDYNNSIFENIVNIIDSSELTNWLIMVCMITIIMLSL